MRAKLADESVPELDAYPILGTSKEHDMTRIVRLIGCVSFACALALAGAGAVQAEEPAKQDVAEPAAVDPSALAEPGFDPATADATVLAETYFDEAERFDAFLTYEVTRGPARALFTIARRWKDGLAELVFDLREPLAFSKWALLLRQTRGGSDDLFAYLDVDRRVRRLPATQLERHAFFEMVAIGDYRPTARGELSYAAAADTEVDGVPCRVVIASTPRPYLGYDEVELRFAKSTGLLLEERYFRRAKEVRRLTAKPADFQEIDGRRVPVRRIARNWPDKGLTEIVLKRILETPDLPDNLFSALNLRKQHFPEF